MLPQFNRTASEAAWFARPVWQLEDGVLYTVEGTQAPLAGRWCVNHRTKQLVGIQVATSAFSQQAFDSASVDRLFEAFSLNEGVGRQYKVVLVGVYDVSLPDPDGMRFVRDARTESLAWWQNETRKNTSFAWSNSMRMDTYLMRIKAFQLPAFKLPKETRISAGNETTPAKKMKQMRRTGVSSSGYLG